MDRDRAIQDLAQLIHRALQYSVDPMNLAAVIVDYIERNRLELEAQ